MPTTIPTPTLVSLSGEPLSLQEAKAFLRVDLADDDALITSLVSAARQWFEVACDRQFCTATWSVSYPDFGCVGELPYPPLVSVVSVTYLVDGTPTALDASTYNVVTGRTPGYIALADGESWPSTVDTHPEAVTVTFTSGYGTASSVPEMVKSGIKLLLAHWYDHRGDAAEVPAAVQAIAWAAAAHRF